MKKILYLAPRIIGILAILFISVFALDVFQEHVPLLQLLTGLTMHLLPSMILAVLLGVAWRYEFVGGILFVVISALPFFFLHNLVWVNVMLGAPFLLTGVLFLASRYYGILPKSPEVHTTH